MMSRILLIDGNHLIYRAFFKFKGLKTLDGKQTSVVYGGPYILESIIRKFGPDKVIVVFDHGRSKFRTNLHTTYKERESKLGEDKEDFFRQRDELMKLLQAMGLLVYRPEGYEADDVITHLAVEYYRKGWDTIIVSADKDFVQLINDGITMYNVSKNVVVTKENCQQHYEYTPRQCVDYLCLVGDDSDNIPGYPGIGPKKAMQFLEKYGSIKKFLRTGEKFSTIDNDKLSKLYDLNQLLIDLMYFKRKHTKEEEIIPLNPNPELNRKKLANICFDNQINTFTKPQFLNTFINLYNGK